MKRKITLALLTVLVILSVVLLSSCEETKIENAVERTEDLDKYEATLVLTLSVNGTESKTTVDMEIKDPEIGKDKEHYKIISENITTEIFKEDTWIYLPKENCKVSERNYLDKGIDFTKYKNILEEAVQELPEGLISSANIKKLDDGEYSLNAKLTKEEISDDYEDAINALKNYYSLKDATVDNASISVTVDGRYVETYELTVDFKIGETVYKVSAFIEYDDPGDSVEIDFPKGYKDYKEVNEIK